MMLCPKHRIEMPIVRWFVIAPLRRCPKCCVEFGAAIEKAKSGPSQFVKGRVVKQRVLPPVVMSERWP